jgi:hypothetical protein
MTISPACLVDWIIRPTLADMAAAMKKPLIESPESIAMMLATAYVESGCGMHLAQQPSNGPAFGLWQIECWASRTAQDVIRRRVHPDEHLSRLWQEWTGFAPFDLAVLGSDSRLAHILMANHNACCMLARLRYLDYEPPMPSLEQAQGIWLMDAAETWANGYWRGADREAGIAKFKNKLSRAHDVLAEVERIREEAVG